MPTIISGDGTITGLTSTGISAAQTVSASNITTGTLPFAQLPTGSVLQIVQGTVAYDATTTSTSYSSSGLFATITPKYSTSKILVTCTSNAVYQATAGEGLRNRIYRGTSGEGSGSSIAAQSYILQTNAASLYSICSISFLDAPATTSAITYTMMNATATAGRTVGWNYGFGTGNLGTMILMEIAA
jgi:hypothetical protein